MNFDKIAERIVNRYHGETVTHARIGKDIAKELKKAAVYGKIKGYRMVRKITLDLEAME